MPRSQQGSARFAAWSALTITCALLSGCDPSAPLYGDGDGDGSNDGNSGDSGGNSDAWFEVGQGEFEWAELETQGPLEMVLGGQGLLMFPMPIRAGRFALPEDPKDYTDPDIPILDIYLDVEGFNIGFGGHFARIANYPMPFEILEDGSYEFIYATLFVPDELINPCDVDELPATIHAELETAEGDLLTFDRKVVIQVPPSLGDNCIE